MMADMKDSGINLASLVPAGTINGMFERDPGAPLTKVNITVNGVPLASYAMEDREKAPRSEVKTADNLLGQEIRRRWDELIRPLGPFPRNETDTGEGDVIDATLTVRQITGG